jgi:hypothetical protein
MRAERACRAQSSWPGAARPHAARLLQVCCRCGILMALQPPACTAWMLHTVCRRPMRSAVQKAGCRLLAMQGGRPAGKCKTLGKAHSWVGRASCPRKRRKRWPRGGGGRPTRAGARHLNDARRRPTGARVPRGPARAIAGRSLGGRNGVRLFAPRPGRGAAASEARGGACEHTGRHPSVVLARSGSRRLRRREGARATKEGGTRGGPDVPTGSRFTMQFMDVSAQGGAPSQPREAVGTRAAGGGRRGPPAGRRPAPSARSKEPTHVLGQRKGGAGLGNRLLGTW